jgi:hypothetical protein
MFTTGLDPQFVVFNEQKVDSFWGQSSTLQPLFANAVMVCTHERGLLGAFVATVLPYFAFLLQGKYTHYGLAVLAGW